VVDGNQNLQQSEEVQRFNFNLIENQDTKHSTPMFVATRLGTWGQRGRRAFRFVFEILWHGSERKHTKGCEGRRDHCHVD
jgi:hypothetical protein